MQSKLAHAAERKAFRRVLDKFIAKSQTQSATEAANELIGAVEKIMKCSWQDGSFDNLRAIADAATATLKRPYTPWSLCTLIKFRSVCRYATRARTILT